MKPSDNITLARIWSKELVEGQMYRIEQLIDIARRIDPDRFLGMRREQIRARIAEETDVGEPKVTQHSWQFRQAGHDLRMYLGVPMNEVERQEALCALTRRELDILRGEAGVRREGRARRRLRGKNGVNVVRKLKAQRNTCGICGDFIYPASPIGCHFDHIVSLANGGGDVLANTRAVHGYCNGLLSDHDDDAKVRRVLTLYGLRTDADAAEVATARAKRVV